MACSIIDTPRRRDLRELHRRFELALVSGS